jgi:hypothetical protein
MLFCLTTTFERILAKEVTTAAQVSSAEDSRARTVKPRGNIIIDVPLADDDRPTHGTSLSRHPSPDSPSLAPPTTITGRLFRRDTPCTRAHTFFFGQRGTTTKATRNFHRDAFLWDEFPRSWPCTTPCSRCLTCARDRAKHKRWRIVVQLDGSSYLSI